MQNHFLAFFALLNHRLVYNVDLVTYLKCLLGRAVLYSGEICCYQLAILRSGEFGCLKVATSFVLRNKILLLRPRLHHVRILENQI